MLYVLQGFIYVLQEFYLLLQEFHLVQDHVLQGFYYL